MNFHSPLCDGEFFVAPFEVRRYFFWDFTYNKTAQSLNEKAAPKDSFDL
jgi:hypothetical protein